MKIKPKLMTRAEMELALEWLSDQACDPDRALSRADAVEIFAAILSHLAVVTDRLAHDADIQAIPVPL